jgi:hypothetical protein
LKDVFSFEEVQSSFVQRLFVQRGLHLLAASHNRHPKSMKLLAGPQKVPRDACRPISSEHTVQNHLPEVPGILQAQQSRQREAFSPRASNCLGGSF